MSWRIVLAALYSLVMLACKTVPAQNDVPARLAEADDASRAAVQRAVNDVLGSDVLLSDSAFTERSILVIENRPRPTLENPMPQGRIMETPVRLQLVLNAGDCLLIDTRDGSRHALEKVSCVPE